MKEKIKLFVKDIFPYLGISDWKINKLLLNQDNKIITKEENEELVGLSIINTDTIYFLGVKKEYRNQGIGSILLEESESYIKEQGYNKIRVAHGKNGYFTPGIPSIKPDTDIKYNNEDLYNGLDDLGHEFFKKRGYYNYWHEDVFDMHMDLKDCPDDYKIDTTINGIYYTKAKEEDLPEIVRCVTDAEKDFVSFYNHKHYFEEDNSMILIAKDGDEVVGTLIVGNDDDLKFGSIGCTSVKTNHRHLGIATKLSMIGTKYLKDKGVEKGFLSFTHTGLDKLYGCAGYNICIYYYMAIKKIK